MNKKIIITLIITTLALIAVTVWMRYPFAETQNAIRSQSPNTTNIAPIKIPNFYNQRDKRWAFDRLGDTSESVGKVGCLISSVAMNFSYYGIDMNSKELN